MSALRVGELVDITIQGARVVNSYPTGEDTGAVLVAKYGAEGGSSRSVAVNLAACGVSVERRAPAEWPPVPGDVWQTIEDPELSAPTYWAAANVDYLADGIGVRLICMNYHEAGSWLSKPEDLLEQGRATLVFPSPLRVAGSGHGDTTVHHMTAGWGGVPGECGVECACGTVFDGFDTIAAAAALLDDHIAARTGGDQ